MGLTWGAGHWLHFVHPDDLQDNLRLWQNSLDTGQPFEMEHRFRRADGVYRWHLSHVHSMRDENGQVAMWIGSNTDIEDQKQTQQEMERLIRLEQSARAAAEGANHAKDEFLTLVSHELRTPLTVILGWAAMLRSGRLNEVAIIRGLDAIEAGAKAQGQLIEDLLDVSRIASGKIRLTVRLVRLGSLISEVLDFVHPAAEAKGIAVSSHINLDVGLVAGDWNRLQQVVSNLLTNAIKFTPNHGKIEVGLIQVGQQAQLTVSDNGQGIDGEFLPYVFDTFRQQESSSTRRHTGLGLGLSIVRHIVEMHGGTVSVQSPGVGLGSTFKVNLPLPIRSPEANELLDLRHEPSVDMAFQPARDLVGVRVLVVDDEAAAREMLAVVLQQCGAEVETCRSADEALERIKQFPPDLLLCDIAMPVRDGYWLIAQVRALEAAEEQAINRDGAAAHRTHLAAVAFTAYVKVELRAQALEAGFDMFVPKPVNPMELLAVIRSLIVPPSSDGDSHNA